MARAGTCTAGDRMRAVIYLAVHELRARWQGWAVLVLLIAVAGGAVLTAAAGAITPARAVLIMVPAVIVIANAIALWPGQATARLSPATVLRAE